MNISYYTECLPAYIKAVDGARNWEELIEAIGPYKLVASDAIEQALQRAEEGDTSWVEFREGLKKERRRQSAGEEWYPKYGDILLPAVMFQVSLVAEQYKAPWGCAYIRLKQVGRITERRGVARFVARETVRP